ncbi:tRNA (adenosine(37)-N6)-threonylcarbamoyltransferase complex ATPase subunit type 1 TsaE [Candidatus Uhrbacteria bacterium]|nr:tRNA (adenosine(37)-N6)-threonylcarbamoyltransferase complex ATPase subunit type 1 TsaE [Candidatus Uhrbacteria bacterium]
MNKRIITIRQGKKKFQHHTRSSAHTRAVAKIFAKSLRGGSVVALSGELGAGKTVFAAGIVAGLGIKKIVTSPTFVLMMLYAIPKKNQKRFCATQLCHIDTYRLSHGKELVDVGVEEYLGNKDTITIIEWPDKIHNLLVPQTVYVRIEFE